MGGWGLATSIGENWVKDEKNILNVSRLLTFPSRGFNYTQKIWDKFSPFKNKYPTNNFLMRKK